MENKDKIIFGVILFGGTLGGSLIRDVRLVQELVRRNYEVHIFWAKDRTHLPELVNPKIHHYWLYHGGRYAIPVGNIKFLREMNELIGKIFSLFISEHRRTKILKRYPIIVERIIHAWIKLTCEGVEQDPVVIRRFAEKINKYKITHVLPILSLYCPWVLAARKFVHHEVKYLVTFQGYEVCADYARHLGLEQSLYTCLYDVVEESGYPAVAVSEAYRKRIIDEIGISLKRIKVIPPGIPKSSGINHDSAIKTINNLFKRDNEFPLVTYLGRCDAEKGIDLLLYAASILKNRGVQIELAICGPTMYGGIYAQACKEIADRLRIPVHWSDSVTNDLRNNLYAASTCVVYPSIHGEPFGMVPIEAMAVGTPVIVPDIGGVADIIEIDGMCGGIRFNTWDSGHLADAIEKLVTNKELREQFAINAPKIASSYSVEILADRVLQHMELPKRAE